MLIFGVFVACVFFYSVLSQRLERTVLTAPMLFTALGILTACLPEALKEMALERDDLLLIAELGLVMTLYTDAARVETHRLRGETNLPVRLLGTGMLLTIVLGLLGAMALFGALSWWEAGILAAILAPTDAGLGQVIVTSALVPRRIRQALNIEAGLNDGLAVPFLMFFIAVAVARETSGGGWILARFMIEQLGYGALIGVGIGLAGGWLLGLAQRKAWVAEPFLRLGVAALPLACVLASVATGASMFIAAFVAGLGTSVGYRDVGKHSVDFSEGLGQLFNLFVFFLFGLFVARYWTQFTVTMIAYAVLSLTLIRMAPVALALKGTGMSWPTMLFIGWFGPRGLASIVLALVYLEGDAQLAGETTIKLTVMVTVLLSIFAHGLSALPAINGYAKTVASLGDRAPEQEAPDAVEPGAGHA
ncbi:sodium/proton antiporter (CPA1 family) [Paraburkholderia rhizosphaerae]|uniref:Sodium/proton antiporter (CPA1 family) n=2 Tax=Paraburkholderia rhizosphaerae TaxID=480658 RepID=A0A4R8LW09_9BURK|nr:sodium/proton antiporter (CPA1 family) [Paraburkholderia rhizosphaerae]